MPDHSGTTLRTVWMFHHLAADWAQGYPSRVAVRIHPATWDFLQAGNMLQRAADGGWTVLGAPAQSDANVERDTLSFRYRDAEALLIFALPLRPIIFATCAECGTVMEGIEGIEGCDAYCSACGPKVRPGLYLPEDRGNA